LDAKQVKALPDDPRPTDVTQCALPAFDCGTVAACFVASEEFAG
jgi:hypothetical protein